jgi:hypothetical protein
MFGRPRSLLCLLAPAALLALAACGPDVQTRTTATEDLADDLATGARVALGGVVAATDLGATFAPDDRADADAALYRAFLAAAPRLDVWPPGAVAGATAPDTLAAVLAAHAPAGRPDPRLVRALAPALAGSRYLALARLTADAARSNAQRQDRQNPEARAEGQPEHDSAWATTVSVEREVTAELTLLDLRTGAVSWQATARASDSQLYEYENPLGRDPVAYVRERLAAAARAERPHLARHGTSLRQPDLIAVLQDGLTTLAGRLPPGGAP